MARTVHGVVDSSDDENEFEEEPATQKGQDSDDVRAKCASHEPAVPTAMGDGSLAEERSISSDDESEPERESSTASDDIELKEKKTPAHNFNRDFLLPTCAEIAALQVINELRL